MNHNSLPSVGRTCAAGKLLLPERISCNDLFEIINLLKRTSTTACLLAPDTINATQCALLMSGIVIVTRVEGGFGAFITPATHPCADETSNTDVKVNQLYILQ
jgi:hypothetical protein